MRHEGSADHHSYTVPLKKAVCGDQVVKAQCVHLAGLEQSAFLAQVVAGADDVRSWAHKAKGGSVGRHVEHVHPQVGIASVDGDVHLRLEESYDVQIIRQWLG